MTTIQCVITAAVENGLRVAAHEVCQAFAGKLAENGLFNCDESEAMDLLGQLEITTKRSAAMKKVRASQKSTDGAAKKPSIRRKPDMVLPFCGVVESSWCKAVRFNHGLHTQCVNGPMGSGEYCKTCQKSAENSASSKPTYGDIFDRAKTAALEYRDPKGKLTTCYANVAKKMGLDLERAQEVATAFGWTIPTEQLIEIATKRGRPGVKGPKKPATKKVKKATVKKSDSMDDQIALLVAEAASEVLSDQTENMSPVKAKKTVKVKAKKAKKVKKADPVKETENVAKKQAAEELKAKKAAETLAKKAAVEAKKVAVEAKKVAVEAKKVAAAELKAKKVAEKLAKKVAVEAKKAAVEAKKVAAAELKAKKVAEKLAKKVAAGELKAKKEAEKLAKKVAAEKLKAKKEAAKTVETVAQVDSSEEEDNSEAESKNSVDAQLEEEEITMPAIGAAVDSSDDDEEEEELELNQDMKTTIGGTDYFKTSAFGLPAVLFSYPSGETVGAYDEATGNIQEIEFED